VTSVEEMPAKSLVDLRDRREIWIDGFKAGFRYADVPLAEELLDHVADANYQERSS
jgi:hypothetical protein